MDIVAELYIVWGDLHVCMTRLPVNIVAELYSIWCNLYECITHQYVYIVAKLYKLPTAYICKCSPDYIQSIGLIVKL